MLNQSHILISLKINTGNDRIPHLSVYSLMYGGFPITISNVTTISFFDTAGEDLNAQETMKTENKYIYNSSGIILNGVSDHYPC